MRCGWMLQLTVWLLTFTGCGASPDGPALDRQSAEELLKNYTAALEEGDSARVYRLWSVRSRDRVGFWTMHFTIGGLMQFPTMYQYMKDLTFDIDRIVSEKEFSVISLNWVAKDPSQPGARSVRIPLRLYVVHEDGRPVFINPIDLLTRNWLTHEAKHVIYHYPPAVRIDEHMIDVSRLDDEIAMICSALDVDLGEKLHYYRTLSPEESGELMLQHPSNGYASTAYKLIVSHEFANTHEAVHLASHIAGIYPANIALSEGLAVGFGGNTRVVPAYATLKSGMLLSSGDYIPLERLFRMDNQSFFRKNYVTYFEAGAFIRFLHERYGTEKLKTLLRSCEAPGGVEDVIRDTYACPLSELETEFLDYLRGNAASVIPTAIPERTEKVFSITDPSGDDVGDGNYKYPNDRFEDGTFDLRAFEVLKDEEFAYFRIVFQRLGEPVTYRPGGERFVPGVVIALNTNQGRNAPPPRRRCHGVEFRNGEGYDILISIGLNVAVVGHDGKVFWASQNDLSRTGKEGRQALEFALPVKLVGTPNPKWKYFVGTCLTSDRTMDFLYAGPMPVRKEEGVFIGGGNYDNGNPAFLDILVPAGQDQTHILSNYNADMQKRAVVPMVGEGDRQD